MAQEPDILGVALSGAGPSVLLITEADISTEELKTRVRNYAGDNHLEMLSVKIASGCYAKG
jgi:homoserine kinase